MDIWADKVHTVLVENDILVHLLVKYFDDINKITSYTINYFTFKYYINIVQ